MDDLASVRLRELIERHGTTLFDPPARLRAMLNDVMPAHRGEVSVLVAAAEEGIPTQLLRVGHLSEPLAAQLSNQLVERRAIDGQAAMWAVDAWATALGVPEIRTHSRQPPTTSYQRVPLLLSAGAGFLATLLAGIGVLAALWPTPNIPPTAQDPSPTTAATRPVVASATPGNQTASFLAGMPPYYRPCSASYAGDGAASGAIASVRCTPAGAPEVVWVDQFPSADAMASQLDALAAQVDALPGACPSSGPARDTWTDGGELAGDYLCFQDANGRARVIWTDRRSLIIAQALGHDEDYLRLHAWWTSAPDL